MKKTLAVLLVLALLAAGGLWMAQRVINRRLAAALPEASARSGLPLHAAALGVSVWNGSAEVRDLSVGNPPGFPDTPLLTLAAGQASLHYLPLLGGKVRLGSVALADLNLTVIRLADKSLNIRRKTAKALPPGAPAPAPEPGEAPAPPAPEGQPAPAVGLDRLTAGVTVRYIDYALADEGKPFELLFKLDVSGSGLATYGDAASDKDWGAVKAQGYMESNGKRAPIQLAGKVAPLSRPAFPSFQLAGTIEKLDAAMLPALLGKNAGIRGDCERVELVLVAQDGRFDESRSRIVLTLKNLKVGDRLLETATLSLPLRGAIDKPKLRVEQALFELLAQALSAPAEDSGHKDRKKKNGLDLESLSKGLESLFKKKP